MKIAAQQGWFDRSDYIETLDIRSELTTNEYECFHEAERAYVFSVLPIDDLM